MKSRLLFLGLFIPFLSFTQVSKDFPRVWITIDNWPENATVLVWSEDFDSTNNQIRRSCLIEQKEVDSNNQTTYTISQVRTLGPEFKEWYIPTVHRHPPADYEGEADPRHYTIVRSENFSRLPSLKELQAVWSRGSYYFNLNRKFKQTLIGINWKLWMLYYNRYPSEGDYLIFQ